MGAGIAQLAARAVSLSSCATWPKSFSRAGMKAIDKSLQRDVDKQRLSPDERALLSSA